MYAKLTQGCASVRDNTFRKVSALNKDTQNPATEARRYLLEREAADLLRTAHRTLQRMRQEGSGPKYFKAGRRVIYTEVELEAWLGKPLDSTTAFKEQSQ